MKRFIMGLVLAIGLMVPSVADAHWHHVFVNGVPQVVFTNDFVQTTTFATGTGNVVTVTQPTNAAFFQSGFTVNSTVEFDTFNRIRRPHIVIINGQAVIVR